MQLVSNQQIEAWFLNLMISEHATLVHVQNDKLTINVNILIRSAKRKLLMFKIYKLSVGCFSPFLPVFVQFTSVFMFLPCVFAQSHLLDESNPDLKILFA